MNIQKKYLLSIFLCLMTTSLVSASYQIVVQAGHEGAVVDFQWHEASSAVVSAGEDGRVIVTRPRDAKVLHRFRVADDRILSMTLDPSDSRAAIVTNRGGSFEVSVWDWEDEESVFSITLESAPLFVSWSAGGRYLAIGKLGSPSVALYDGSTGRRLTYLQRLPSLYDFGYIGSTETILMTYASTGSLRYWDVRSSALKLSAETVPGLENLVVLQTGDKSTVFGTKDDTMYLFNRQTGAVLDSKIVAGLFEVSVDPERGELAVLSRGLLGNQLQYWDLSRNVFVAENPSDPFSGRISLSLNMSTDGQDTTESVTFPASSAPSKVLRINGITYLVDSSGNMSSGAADQFSHIIEDQSWRPGDLVFHSDGIYLINGTDIRRFSSPFFEENSRGDVDELAQLTKEIIEIDGVAESTGLEIFPNGDLLLWDKVASGREIGYRIVDFDNPNSIAFYPTSAPLLDATILEDESLLLVDRNGSIRIVEPTDGSDIFSFGALGLLDAGYSPDDRYLLVGRSSSGSSGSPLERVDAITGETVPVEDDRFLVYNITHGPRGLYTIGLERDPRNGNSTSLVRHNLDDPSETRILHSVESEDMDALILPHSNGTTVYTTLGDVTTRIVGSRKTRFAATLPIVSLALRGNILYGIDEEGGLNLWNANTGRSILRIVFFQDGGWIAIPAEGDRLWSSPDAINNVILYRNGQIIDPRRVGRLVEEYRDDPRRL